MIKKLLIIIFVLGFGAICFAKDTQQVQTSAKQSFEEKHKDKKAILLLYELETKLNEDWSYATRVHVKTKILKEEAKNLGEITLDYEKGREGIVKIQAYTITADNKKHRYTKIQDLNIYPGYPMYSDFMVKVITLPQVNIGSIVEYEYTKVSKGMPIKNAFWHEDNFIFSLPVKELQVSFTMPKKLSIKYKEFNLSRKPKITENSSAITYSWQINEIDDYEEAEDFIPRPRLEFVDDDVEFSSLKSWKDISDWYYSLIQKNLKINKEIEAAAKNAVKDCKTSREKIRAILEYVEDNFRYVSMSFGNNALEPHPTDEVFKNKYGDCKDLSLMCMAMLKAVGIKSYIALFRDDASITDPKDDLPMPSLFDHVLLLAQDEVGEVYIDPLLKGYDLGQYPLGFQAGYTFVITENGGKMGRLPAFDEKRLHTKTIYKITIAGDGSAVTESDVISNLDDSIELREAIKAMSEEEKQRFFRFVDTAFAGAEVLERRIDGLNQRYGLVKSHTKFRRNDAFPVTDGMIIIPFEGIERGTSFSEKDRKKPIFFPANILTESEAIYRIPAGFRVSYLPNNLELDIGFFGLKREFKVKGNEIIVTASVRNRRLELPKQEYKRVKVFFDQLPAKTQQRIVLKKIKPLKERIQDFLAKFRKAK